MHEAPPPDVDAIIEPERRSFFRKVAAIVVGGLAMIIPGGAGLAVLLDPLRRKSGNGGFIRITSLEALPADGTPRRFPVIADKVDAWNKLPSTKIGAVYLQRQGETVHAFHPTCPHLGCAVDAVAGGGFKCPCHDSTFNADGSLAPNSVSPRGLDPLEIDPEALKQGIVKVRFQNFITGTPDRIARS